MSSEIEQPFLFFSGTVQETVDSPRPDLNR